MKNCIKCEKIGHDPCYNQYSLSINCSRMFQEENLQNNLIFQQICPAWYCRNKYRTGTEAKTTGKICREVNINPREDPADMQCQEVGCADRGLYSVRNRTISR